MESFRIPLLPGGQMVEVAIPGDIAITVTEIHDMVGEPVPIGSNWFKFEFTDRRGAKAVCVHDPSGRRSLNTRYNAETDELRLLITTRCFVKGPLWCKTFTRTADSDFDDGFWDVCTRNEKINLKLTE